MADALYELSTHVKLSVRDEKEDFSPEEQLDVFALIHNSFDSLGDLTLFIVVLEQKTEEFNFERELPPFFTCAFTFLPKVKFAFSADGNLLALIFLDEVEIRFSRDRFNVPVAKTIVPYEPKPEWRRIAWSECGCLLLLSRSTPVIDVLDISGGPCYSIDVEGVGYSTELSFLKSIAALETVKLEQPTQQQTQRWLDMLYVLQYKGKLSTFLIGAISAYQPLASFDLCAGVSPGVFGLAPATCLQVLRRQKLVVIGGTCLHQRKMDSATLGQQPSAVGISLWRQLDSEPYFIRVSTVSDENRVSDSTSKMQWLLSRLPLYPSQKLSVVQLCVNPDESLMSVITSNGAVLIFRMPSLQLIKSWPIEIQPYVDHRKVHMKSYVKSVEDFKEYLRYPVCLAWWSDKELAVSRVDGSVSICNFESFENSLRRDCEYFSPWVLLQSVDVGDFFIFEKRLSSKFFDDEGDDETEQLDDETPPGWIAWSIKSLYRTVKSSASVFYAKPVPRREVKSDRQTSVYKIHQLKSITPDELYKKKLDNGEYGEALLLAQTYSFDTDLVYKRQWEQQPISKHTIKDYLAKIRSDEYVLEQCISKIPASADSCYYLLQHGLKRTPAQRIDVNKLTDRITNFCLVRLKLLHYLDLLNDYEEMLRVQRRDFGALRFETLCRLSFAEIAVDLARNSEFASLQNFLSRHWDILQSHLLPILDNIAEVCSPSDYVGLIPGVSLKNDHQVDVSCVDWGFKPWRQHADWVESHEILEAMEQSPAPDWALCDSIYASEAFSELKSWIFQSKHENGKTFPRQFVSKWCAARAKQIEACTGIPRLAREFLEVSIEKKGFVELLDLQEDVNMLCMFVYDCQADLSWNRLTELKADQGAAFVMQFVSNQQFLELFRSRLMPYFQYYEKRHKDTASVQKLVFEYLRELSKSDLCPLYKVVEAWRLHGETFTLEPAYIALLATECLCVCERTDQTERALKLISLLCGPEQEQLNPDLELLLRQLQALQTLASSYQIELTLAQLKDIAESQEASEQLLKRIIKQTVVQDIQAVSSGKSLRRSIAVYRTAFIDMRKFCQTVLHRVTDFRCRQIFVERLLASGDFELISFSAEFLQLSKQDGVSQTKSRLNLRDRSPSPMRREFGNIEKIPYKDAMNLLVSAAQEYFNAAQNSSDVMLDLSRRCLCLTVDRIPEISREVDLIQALPLLEDLQVKLLPLQIRIAEDKLQLLCEAVQASSSNYKELKKLLKIASFLQLDDTENSKTCRGKLSSVCAEKALEMGDFLASAKYCDHVMQLDYAEGWSVCRLLALCDEFSAFEIRLSLLSFALKHCDRFEEFGESLIMKSRELKLQLCISNLRQPPPLAGSSFDVDAATSAAVESAIYLAATPLSVVQNIATKALRKDSSGTSQALSTSLDFLSNVVTSTTSSALGGSVVQQQTKQQLEIKQMDLKELCEKVLQQVANEAANRRKNDKLEKPVLKLASSPMTTPLECFNLKAVTELELKIEHSECFRLATTLLRAVVLDGLKPSQPESDSNFLSSSLLTDAVLCFVREAAELDTNLAISGLLLLHQLGLPVEKFGSAFFYTFQADAFCTETAMYFYCLLFCAETLERPGLEMALARNPRDLIDHLWKKQNQFEPVSSASEKQVQIATKLRQLAATLSTVQQVQTLGKLSVDIDVSRFSMDNNYKLETVLGLAMTEGESKFNLALSLAKEYDVPLWDFYMAHLEFLLTSASSSCDDKKLIELIKDRSLLEVLGNKSKQLLQRLKTNVFPLLDGRSVEQMTLYFWTIENGCAKLLEEASDALAHSKCVRVLQRDAKGIDYKLLSSGKPDALKTLLPYITPENLSNFVKVALCMPPKIYQKQHVHFIWCLKSISQSLSQNQSPMESAKGCLSSLTKLDPSLFLELVQDLVFQSETVAQLKLTQKQNLLDVFIKFARQKQWSDSPQFAVLESWRIFLSWFVEAEGILFPTLKFKKKNETLFRLYLTRGDKDQLTEFFADWCLPEEGLQISEALLDVFNTKQERLKLFSVSSILLLGVDRILDFYANSASDEASPGRPSFSVQRIKQILETTKQLDHLVYECALEKVERFCCSEKCPPSFKLSLLTLCQPLSDQTTRKRVPSEVTNGGEQLVDQESLTEPLQNAQFTQLKLLISFGWEKAEILFSPADLEEQNSRKLLLDRLLDAATRADQLNIMPDLIRMLLLSTEDADNKLENVDSNEANIAESLWLKLFEKFIQQKAAGEKLPLPACERILSLFEETNAQRPFSVEGAKAVSDLLARVPADSAKVASAVCLLLSHHQSLLDLLVARLNKLTAALNWPDRFYRLLIQQNVIASIVGSRFYASFSDWLLSLEISQIGLLVPVVVDQLGTAGLQAEAGYLLLHSSGMHPALCTYSAALNMFKRHQKQKAEQQHVLETEKPKPVLKEEKKETDNDWPSF